MESAHNVKFNFICEDNILKSNIDTSLVWPKNASAAEYILSKAKENASNGNTEWVTNSVTGHSVKLNELETASRKVASAMYKRGMGKGDVAVYLTTDVTSIYKIIIGIWRVGGILYASYPEDTHDTLAVRLKEAKARWIFCDPNSATQCIKASCEVEWTVENISFGKCEQTTDVEELFLDNGDDCPEEVPARALDDPLIILCTSGTTGPSKGVVHTNKSVLAFCVNTAYVPRKLAMLISRSTHMSGINIPMYYACLGLPLIMMQEFRTRNILSSVSKYKPCFAFGLPTHLMRLANSASDIEYDLSSLEAVCATGMPVTESFYEGISLLPNVKLVLVGYGLTECGMLASNAYHVSPTSTKPDVSRLSVGHLGSNRALKILDVATGQSLGPMTRGEIVVRSPSMASGYWRRPEETATVFVDGWFKTGDLGYYDNDGYIFIEDRLKDTFKYYNNHISPTELEAIIMQHPAVSEAVVFGIEDPEGGDHVPRALVVMKAEKTAAAAEIRQFTDSKVALYKQLRGGLYVVDALPKGGIGKVSRFLAAKIPLSV